MYLQEKKDSKDSNHDNKFRIGIFRIENSSGDGIYHKSNQFDVIELNCPDTIENKGIVSNNYLIYDAASFEEVRRFLREGKAIDDYILGYATMEEINEVLFNIQVYYIMGDTSMLSLSATNGRSK